MQNYLIIGGSSGIGQELAAQLSQSGNQVIATFNKNEPTGQNPQIRFHHLNVLEETPSLDFLPDELAGFAYCPGSINLRPFERIKPADFETDYKLQVIGAIKLIQLVLPRLKKAENAAKFAMSSVVPIPFKGCRSALASFFCSLFNNEAAKGVSVNEGAIQFTLILGASSAASAFVKPSIAPLEAAT
jgi:NAD(P)-dependent dehydrogenase (short-subunit alcohol dehydrogenase family)